MLELQKIDCSAKSLYNKKWRRSMENDLEKLDIHGNSVAVVVDES
jgi:hypothetical protein